MKLIICWSSNKGIAFHHRRVSRDAAVIADIETLLCGKNLLIHPSSLALFDGSNIALTCQESFLSDAGAEDFVFVESDAYLPFEDDIDQIISYNWNRDYPADTYFRMDLSAFEQTESVAFAGHSHENIQRDIWTRA
ncbi:MAG: ribonuclease Z [Clostridiales bacterium]|nr:ribonuclease Z [Candidatus Cacconaster stercorequi]